DSKWLTSLPGVGTATAEQIVATLKRKVTRFTVAQPAPLEGAAAEEGPVIPLTVDGNVLEDAYQALLSVGLSHGEARKRLDTLLTGGKTFGSAEEVLLEIYKEK